jgi:hypothetical protein
MDKRIIMVIGVLAVLLLIGGGAFYAMKPKITSGPATNEGNLSAANQNNPTGTPQSIQGTLKNLLTEGKSVSCTYTNNQANYATSGTVYVANGKMRSDFKSTMADKPETSGHIIVDGTYSYVWTDQNNQGFKVLMAQPTTSPAAGQTGGSQGPDLNQQVNYTCNSWTPDNSMFSLPANVTFQEFKIPTIAVTGTGENPAANSGDNTNPACAACNNVPAGPGRDACKTQLHCQ